MTTPRRKPPAKAPRPAPPVRQQGAWGNNHHSRAKRFDASGNRLRGRARAAAWWKRKRAQAAKLRRGAKAASAPMKSARARWNARTGTTSARPPARGNVGHVRTSGATRRARQRIGRPRKRGTLFALFSVAIGAMALTAVVLELTSLAAASEMAFVADGLGMLAAWWVGEPSDSGPIRQKRAPGAKPGATGGCSPACMHGNPAKAADCKCSCGGSQHGTKRGKGAGGAAAQTSTPKPRTRKPRAKPAGAQPSTPAPKTRQRATTP